MLAKFKAENGLDKDGKPAGGVVNGTGMAIVWQNGPLGRGGDRQEPNGAFVETVIAAAKQRIEFYEGAGFMCIENKNAIYYLDKALSELDARTRAREEAGVEGTHERRNG